jgi:glucans biosynthesis protein C
MLQKQNRSVWLDYLRGFVTVLVVAHHSSLAYTTFASFDKVVYMRSTHPVVDTARSLALDIFEDFNDVFFMSLMFLISGIFVMPALARKGPRIFIRDRFYRLFIPFAIAVTFVMPFAYLPAWHLAHGNYDMRAFLIDYVKVEGWPSGPPWFIWVLFAFNLIVGVLYLWLRPLLERWASAVAGLAGKPWRVFLLWYLLTLVLLLPMVVIFGASAWTGFGPFAFQLSRPLLYFGYFVLGMLLGSAGPDKGLLAKDSRFNAQWGRWIGRCLLAWLVLQLSYLSVFALQHKGSINELQARLLNRPFWALSCTASSIAFLTLFRRLFTRGRKTWDALSANAYGIYLVHYVFVTWFQFLLLPVALPAVVKFAITFILSLTISWLLTALIRKIPIVRKYL